MFQSFNQVSEFQSLQRASFPISRNAWVSSQGVCVSVCVSLCVRLFVLVLSVSVCVCLCLYVLVCACVFCESNICANSLFFVLFFS